MLRNFQMQLQLFFTKFGPEDVLYFPSATEGMSHALFQIVFLL